MFYKPKTDQIKAQGVFKGHLKRLCELGLLKEQNSENSEQESEYEVRRYIRAKITSEFCEEFYKKLKENAGSAE